MTMRNRIYENTATFENRFSIIDGALRTNVSYYSENFGNDDVAGVMLFSNYNITDDKKKIMLALSRDLKTYTISTNKVFINRYTTFENGIDAIYPNEWIFERAHNASFKDEIWYYIVNPENDPERESKWTPAYYDAVLGYWMVSLITPIYEGNEFIGTTGGDITLNDVSKQISEYKYDKYGYSFIFDNEKNILIHPEYIDEINKKSEMEELFSFTDIKEKGLSDIISKINDGYGWKNFIDNDTEYTFIYYKLDSIGWYYGFVIESEYIVEQAPLEQTKDTYLIDSNNFLSIENMIYIFIIILIIFGILIFTLDRLKVIKMEKNLALTLLSLATLIIIALFVFNAYTLTKTITADSISTVSEKLTSLADSTKQQIGLYLEEHTEKMEVVATQQDLTNEELTGIMNLQNDFYEIFVLDPNGTVIRSTDMSQVGKDKSNDSYFINGKISSYIKPAYFSETTNKETIAIATPFHSGVLVGRVDVIKLSELVYDREGLGKSGEILLAYTNMNGDAVFFTEQLFGDENSKIISKEDTEKPITQAVLKKEELFLDAKDYNNGSVIVVTRYIEEADIGMVVKMNRAEILGRTNGINNQIWYFTAGIILAIFIAGLIFIFLLTKSLRKEVRDKTAELQDKTIALQDKTDELQINVEHLKNTKTAILNMMDDLNETNKHLKDLDEAKTNFLNVASHELKTPLTAMSAYLDVLDDDKGSFNEEQKMGLDAIKRNSNQLKMLINNILEISRIESGRFEVNITEVDVKAKILLAVDNLKILAENKNLSIKTEIAENLPKIMTDDMRFDEILNNLISNAIKFTDTGSITIKADVEKSGKFITLRIIDTGVGIPEDKLNNLFQNFYQVDSSISRKYGGTGLGLALTKKIVEHQGGTINVESLPGKGTTFTFNLPIKQGKDNKDKIEKQ